MPPLAAEAQPDPTIVAVVRSGQELGDKGDWVVDEDASSRHLIRQHLEQSPEERLRNLEAFYEVFLFGQRQLGRAVFEPE